MALGAREVGGLTRDFEAGYLFALFDPDTDLCSAWNALPCDRREAIRQWVTSQDCAGSAFDDTFTETDPEPRTNPTDPIVTVDDWIGIDVVHDYGIEHRVRERNVRVVDIHDYRIGLDFLHDARVRELNLGIGTLADALSALAPRTSRDERLSWWR